jgi:holo-[acyl-carrier protein] synthase
MILKTGIDLIEIERFHQAYNRHGERLFSRIFTDQERIETQERIESLAARFAAKEAVSKALGTGIGVVGWKEIEIIRGKAQEPMIRLHGKAKVLAKSLGLVNWAVSLTHNRDLAIASVVANGPTSK